MPIHVDISALNRLVIAVVIGDANVDDVMDLARRFSEAGTRHYRKILDITAGALIIDDDELVDLVVLLRSQPNADSRGPMAFVVDPGRAHVAEKFADLSAGDRPVKVFQSLHAARRWLDECAAVRL